MQDDHDDIEPVQVVADMDIKTPLDAAFMNAHDDADQTYQFYQALFDADLFLPVEDEFDDGDLPDEGLEVSPVLYELDGSATVVVFDSEERFAAFIDEPLNYIRLPGVAIFQMFNGEFPVGVNIGVAPSAVVLPPEMVAWLHVQATEGTEHETIPAGSPVELSTPQDISREALASLTARLAQFHGDVDDAVLVEMRQAESEEGRLFLALAPSARGVARAEMIAEEMAQILRAHVDNTKALEISVLDKSSEVLQSALNVGLKLPILDTSSMN